MIKQMIDKQVKELNLYYDVDTKKFECSEDKKENKKLIFHLEYDELIKMTSGEYHSILEKEGYEKY